jgi:hypothetical protein
MLIVGSLLASSVARTSKGILVGVARDASGAVVVNATVTIVGNPRQILWLQLSCWFAVRATSAASHPLHYSTALGGQVHAVRVVDGRFRGGAPAGWHFANPLTRHIEFRRVSNSEFLVPIPLFAAVRA